MSKLELTVLPTSLSVIKKLDKADAFLIGEKEFGLRLPIYFSFDEIKEIIYTCKEREQKIFIAVNKIIHEKELTEVDEYLNKLSTFKNIDGIVFGDLAVYQLSKKYNLLDKLIYNPETYLTNYQSVNFFANKGMKRVSISKEITLEDIKTIAAKKLTEIEILGHGVSNMFHSKRDLISNYFKYLNHLNVNKYNEKELYMIEEIRNEKLPIIQDQFGTHVFSGYDLCTIGYLDQLIESNISSIRINGLFKEDNTLIEIFNIYRKAIDDYYFSKDSYLKNRNNYIEDLKRIDNIRPFNEGFLFKKTKYKGE